MVALENVIRIIASVGSGVKLLANDMVCTRGRPLLLFPFIIFFFFVVYFYIFFLFSSAASLQLYSPLYSSAFSLSVLPSWYQLSFLSSPYHPHRNCTLHPRLPASHEATSPSALNFRSWFFFFFFFAQPSRIPIANISSSSFVSWRFHADDFFFRNFQFVERMPKSPMTRRILSVKF